MLFWDLNESTPNFKVFGNLKKFLKTQKRCEYANFPQKFPEGKSIISSSLPFAAFLFRKNRKYNNNLMNESTIKGALTYIQIKSQLINIVNNECKTLKNL